MKRFRYRQRVRVVRGEPLGGKGTVVRLKIADDGAWVKMDTLRDNLRVFPIGDDRQNHIELFPEMCEELITDN